MYTCALVKVIYLHSSLDLELHSVAAESEVLFMLAYALRSFLAPRKLSSGLGGVT